MSPRSMHLDQQWRRTMSRAFASRLEHVSRPAEPEARPRAEAVAPPSWREWLCARIPVACPCSAN